ncbi:hybrid sensor histidine kinase/response regulator [Croceicoccus hydrothermalis]|uniref:ATP-binding response regulator n=1 Tax=Croceicoccus hydrothermalis TaxID=2867964 RepID=UPI001EFA7C01|nr:hybrid sensor histidine kinase/response regulator [Croceicoccus hydrothermalis]
MTMTGHSEETDRAVGATDDAPSRKIAALEAENARLSQEVRRAQSANEAKSRFLASLSHEIRSPLNAIYGHAQLLERKEGRDAMRAAQIIRRSCEHLTNLVEGLLDLSQVENGVLRLQRDAIRFPALLDQMIAMFEPQARVRGISLILERPDSLPEFVRGDPKRLRQVLINLLSNAIKFTKEGSVTLAVHYRSDIASFEVRDTGVGIPAEDCARVFDPFERGDETRAALAPGAGLGLSITRALVHMMGGDIAVESTVGEGSRFTVRMMLSQPPSAPAGPAPTARIAGYSDAGQGEGRRRILIVDDDAEQAEMVEGLLEPLGFDIAVAANGEDAIAMAERRPPALVLLDISMPGRTGWETAEILRARHGRAMRIVMVSANAHELDGGGDGRAANDGFLLKPFDFGSLLDLVAQQLGIEWTAAGGTPPAAAPSSDANAAAGAEADAASCLSQIERDARRGDVRALDTRIADFAALAPDAAALTGRMRDALDAFDLAALARIAAEGAAR